MSRPSYNGSDNNFKAFNLEHPDAVILDEQKELKDQPRTIQTAVQRALETAGVPLDQKKLLHSSGRDLYRELSNHLGSAQAASRVLHGGGVSGIAFDDDVGEKHVIVFTDSASERNQGVIDKNFQGAGPSPNSDVVGGTELYQWQNLPEWKIRLTDWMKKEGYDQAEIDKYIKGVEAQMTIIEALGPRLAESVVGAGQATKKKKNGGISFSGPIRSNADEIYLISFDASSMCVKRLSAAKTAKVAEDALGRPLTVDEQLALISLYRAAGKDAPCVHCYVESNRRKATQAVGVARDIVFTGNVPARWGKDRKAKAQAAVDEFKAAGLTLEDIKADYVLDPARSNTDEAKAAKEQFPAIYDFMNSEALATKQNQVKLYEEYRGELLDMTPEQVELLNGYAGIRFFSSSDFQVEHLVDLVQAMWDMKAMGAKSHAYTKVPMYVRIFGNSGQKINMSCFAKEDPVTGEIKPDIAQGWDWAEAREMRQKYKDCGTVFVASSDKVLR